MISSRMFFTDIYIYTYIFIIWTTSEYDYLQLYTFIYTYHINIGPHEAVPEVSKGKVHITQDKHVPIV